jgi:hypothetical protein
MRELACIVLLFCFFVSTICVPEGDFSLLPQLPALYKYCKTTEDSDMNFIDFLTDHLINIDGIFDKHLPGDDQKPHHPFQFHNVQHAIVYTGSFSKIDFSKPVFELIRIKSLKKNSYHSNYIAYVFHPPDACLYFQMI